MYVIEQTVRESPTIQRVLREMPPEVADTFSDDQLRHLNKALGGRSWARHKIDCRGSFNFWRGSYYFVFLAGKNVRELTRLEQQTSRITLALLGTLFLVFSFAVGMLFLYLLKSALGIDLLDGISLGIWDKFRQLW
ncbi:3-phosphoshikimate 1-carboxyvinyltransferase [Alteromonas pelagimontana]|uniref:3-phosphoshikimate 1-carboxyvinyltransferase n=1 Tax=Alteromonas pelagimontana TaxID=1858656 RepID=A0A6M4MDH7_9ALTE|nr:hypothetical protein [Alteromonas pelagimontana]QJR80196.1 3-phosphoshikimate 1-carboxyvinyltransferase [Alteromonas pelagimontana]